MPPRPVLSIVTPAFNEAENLPVIAAQLTAVLERIGLDWEWIVVDDHSSDATFTALTRLAADNPRIRGCRLARNSGSHAAIACGLASARGDAAIVLSADGQEPPEVLPALVEAWRGGAQVVWAARSEAPPAWTSRAYYLIMRRVAGLTDLAPMGADCLLLDRAVIVALGEFGEHHINLFALVNWMGFRQAVVPCARQPRVRGRSGWTLRRKIELLVDSVTGFSYLPIRAMSYLGALTAIGGLIYAAVVIVNATLGHPPQGWSSLMVAVLVIGGVQMLMIGVLGEYLWRTLGEARRRPRYSIEATIGRVPSTETAVHAGRDDA